MMMVSVSFSASICNISISSYISQNYPNAVLFSSSEYKSSTIVDNSSITCSTPSSLIFDLYDKGSYKILNFTQMTYIKKSAYGGGDYYVDSTQVIGSYYICSDSSKKYDFSTSTCKAYTPTPICTADQDLVAGICVPKCPSGQSVGTDGRCAGACSSGSHWDYNATVPACAGDIKYGEKLLHDSGAYHVLFADGALMYCRTDGKCTTTNLEGNVIDNRWYEGSIPPAPNVYTDLFNDALTITGNLIGKTLQFAGYTVGLSASGAGLLMSDNPVTGALNPGVLAGAGLVSLGNLLVSDSEKILMTPKQNEPMNVKIVTNSSSSSDSFDSVSSKTPSDGTPVFSQNGLYTYKQITDANLKTVWDTAAGVGTLPPNSLVRGSDIIYPTNNPNTAIINSPTQVEIIKTNPDNTAQSVVINKSDLANTAKNGTDLPYVAKDYAAPQINNNGTVTQPTTSTPSSTSPKTNDTVSTNPKTGDTTTQNAANASGVATTSDGKSIDLSGVKGSIDQLGKQLEKGNGLLEKGNGLLEKGNSLAEAGNGILNGIKSDTGSMRGSLNDIKDLMSQSSDGLSEHEWTNGIPTDYSVFETWKDTWNNLKTSYDSVSSKGDELLGIVNGDSLTLDLPKGSVQQCPYNGSLDFVFAQIPLSFDLCAVFFPLRAVFYTMFYLFFVFKILFASLKTLMRMA